MGRYLAAGAMYPPLADRSWARVGLRRRCRYMALVVYHGQFECEREGCGETFASAFDAQEHARVSHFSCGREGCEMYFSSNANARRHAAIMHDGMRFPCEIEGCDEYFVSASDARRHATDMHF